MSIPHSQSAGGEAFSSSTPQARSDAPEVDNDVPSASSYPFPPVFKVGFTRVAPFTTALEIKAHLSILYAFTRLKLAVENLSYEGHGVSEFRSTAFDTLYLNDDMPKAKEPRWAWFVGLAVERFEKWCRNLPASHSAFESLEDHLPPIDVLMVWHAYLLNPGWLEEDRYRHPTVLGGLESLCYKFSNDLANITPFITSPASDARMKNWVDRTDTPFDPFEAAFEMTTRTVSCPSCSCSQPVALSSKNGYLQRAFSHHCTKCEEKITHERLGLERLHHDLLSDDAYLAGTVLTIPNRRNIVQARRIKTHIKQSPAILRIVEAEPRNQWTAAKAKQLKDLYPSFTSMKRVMEQRMTWGGGKQLLDRILSAYRTGRIFSIDLVGAVLRQGSFSAKMEDLGWTNPGFFDEDENAVVLQHSIARYHAFLDLMASLPQSFLVPTLDIDLAWHTHQMKFKVYAQDCVKSVRRFVDHNDKVEENHLYNSFDLTCRAWEDRFGFHYTHCGCPLPGKTIGQRLRALVTQYTGDNRYPSLTLPSQRIDIRRATHTSDHNAVYPRHWSTAAAARASRKSHYEQRLRRDIVQASQAGEPDPRDMLGDHKPAFLVPVPMQSRGSVPARAPREPRRSSSFDVAAPVEAFVDNLNPDGGVSYCAVGASACLPDSGGFSAGYAPGSNDIGGGDGECCSGAGGGDSGAGGGDGGSGGGGCGSGCGGGCGG